MNDNQIDLNALGQVIDTSWGRSSTPKSSSYSVKAKLTGQGTMILTYTAIVKFVTRCDMIVLKRAYAEEADKITNEALTNIKSSYKSLTKKTLTTKIDKASVNDSLEVVSYNSDAPSRSAYYRRNVLVQVGLRVLRRDHQSGAGKGDRQVRKES